MKTKMRLTIKSNLKKAGISFFMMLFCITLYAQNKPTVYVLATGGTIAGSGKTEVSSSYTAGGISVEKLLDAVPALAEVAQIKSEQIADIGSQDMNVTIWLTLTKRINELAKDKNIAGFVITHGTDTQDETAFFLNLTVKTDRPVVLVGSMRPATALSADGPKNLYNAVACAAAPESAGKGVMVVMDDKIYGADDLVKMHTLTLGAFDNPNYGLLGMMYNGKPMFTRQSMKRHTVNSEFDVANLTELPKVEIVMAYAGATPLFINAAVQDKVKGLVYAGVGNGNMPTSVQSALVETVKKGIPVVRSSRLPMGPTSQWDEIDDDACGFSASWYLSPQKARVLLMLALTKTTNYKEIQRIFTEY